MAIATSKEPAWESPETEALEFMEEDEPVKTPHLLPQQVTKELVQVFKLLSDETRLKILCLLFHRQELNVRTLCELLDQSQPAVSHHLALLRSARLIESRREGKHNFYHVLMERFEEVMATVFSVSPDAAGTFRFRDFELTYSQRDGSPLH
jgi:ArsR family transcriptional regulator